MKTAVVAVE